jgi:hypothetical protein
MATEALSIVYKNQPSDNLYDEGSNNLTSANAETES